MLNGAKRWCAGADFADHIHCLVRFGPAEEGYLNLSFLLVPRMRRASPSSIKHVNPHYPPSSDVYFDNVRLPLTAVVVQYAGA